MSRHRGIMYLLGGWLLMIGTNAQAYDAADELRAMQAAADALNAKVLLAIPMPLGQHFVADTLMTTIARSLVDQPWVAVDPLSEAELEEGETGTALGLDNGYRLDLGRVEGAKRWAVGYELIGPKPKAGGPKVEQGDWLSLSEGVGENELTVVESRSWTQEASSAPAGWAWVYRSLVAFRAPQDVVMREETVRVAPDQPGRLAAEELALNAVYFGEGTPKKVANFGATAFKQFAAQYGLQEGIHYGPSRYVRGSRRARRR